MANYSNSDLLVLLDYVAVHASIKELVMLEEIIKNQIHIKKLEARLPHGSVFAPESSGWDSEETIVFPSKEYD